MNVVSTWKCASFTVQHWLVVYPRSGEKIFGVPHISGKERNLIKFVIFLNVVLILFLTFLFYLKFHFQQCSSLLKDSHEAFFSIPGSVTGDTYINSDYTVVLYEFDRTILCPQKTQRELPFHFLTPYPLSRCHRLHHCLYLLLEKCLCYQRCFFQAQPKRLRSPVSMECCL